jgi:tRNA G18 (ribose-2'-O)-methylase SpoU
MPTIVAIDDPCDERIEAYCNVRERDLVGRDGLFMAEGRVVLEKLVAGDACRPMSVLIAAKRIDSLQTLLNQLPPDVPVFAGSQSVIDQIAGFPLHRGILAIGRGTESWTPGTLLAALSGRGDVLLLSAIANHDNMGAIFRNAAAFGAKAVLLDSDCCDPLYRKAIRVSVGATLLVPWARLARGADALALLREHGFHPIALSPSGSKPLHSLEPSARNAVILGAEGAGLSPELIDEANSVRIDMSAGFDSLNVATTSGIVLHHLATRRKLTFQA